MKAVLVTAVIWAAASGISLAQGLSPVSLANQVNTDLTNYTGGGNYPQNGGPLTVNTVGFQLSTIGSQSHTAIIQTAGQQGVLETHSIPVNRSGVSVVYTLIDSIFGGCGTAIGELDFVGVNSTFTYTLTEGDNVRDHFNDGFCNSVTGVAGTANFGADRLDMQQINLPAGFANDTLLRIDFKNFGAGNGGAPFLAAVTMDGIPTIQSIESVPMLSPGTLAALVVLLPLLGFGLMRRLHGGNARPE